MLKKKIDNPRYPHTIRIVRKEKTEDINPFIDGEVKEIILYEGKGRGYTDTTTTGSSSVESNKRKASIPVRFDEWGGTVDVFLDETGNPFEQQVTRYVPMSGDEIEVWKDKWYERGVVKDAEPDNDRTVVYWEMVRN